MIFAEPVFRDEVVMGRIIPGLKSFDEQACLVTVEKAGVINEPRIQETHGRYSFPEQNGRSHIMEFVRLFILKSICLYFI